jgi:hypothetical protein
MRCASWGRGIVAMALSKACMGDSIQTGEQMVLAGCCNTSVARCDKEAIVGV